MFFGHEPDFSNLIARLIAPRGDARIMMKKGACCALDLPNESATNDVVAKQLAGSATLVWLMTARQLARIAGSVAAGGWGLHTRSVEIVAVGLPSPPAPPS